MSGNESGRRISGRGADILAECLIAAGIDRIFGVPGDTGVVFYDALYARTDRITHVLARDERSAAFMADGYARATNRVGVVEVSSGGGVDFLVSGMGEAFAASVPMLAITSDIHRRSRGTGAITEIDQEALFSAVAKAVLTVESAASIPQVIDQLLQVATSGRPGPVVAVFPEDVFDEQADDVEVFRLDDRVPLRREMPPGKAIGRAAEALAAAERPAIVAGSGVHLSRGWAELEALAERAGIPVATTIHGKGAIAETHPLALGVAGANGARPYTNAYLEAADIVLLVGTRANSTDTNGFSAPPRDGPTIVQIDIDPTRAGRNYPGSLDLAGDARDTLALLAVETPANPERVASISREIAAARQAWRLAAVEPHRILPADQLDPRDVTLVLHELLADDVTVVADPGTPTPNVASFWECPVAGRTVIDPRGHGPMGYAIPAAMGIALATGRPVLGLTADGSFAMSCGELETAARYRLPILYVQFTNGSLGWIKMLQHLYLGGRYFGVEPGPINAAAVANAMGIEGIRVTTLAQLREVATSWRTNPRPIYVDIAVPDQIALPPPVAPWTAALEGAGTRPVY